MAKKRRKKPPVRRNVENKVQEQKQAKVVKTESGKNEKSTRKTTASRKRPTSPRDRKPKQKKRTYSAEDMIFGRENYTFMIAGLLLIIVGFFLMRGGAMPDANTWDANRIYSFTRITLAPILILAGLGLEIYAIFKSSNSASETEEAEA